MHLEEGRQASLQPSDASISVFPWINAYKPLCKVFTGEIPFLTSNRQYQTTTKLLQQLNALELKTMHLYSQNYTFCFLPQDK